MTSEAPATGITVPNKNWLVTLRLYLGEYEKMAQHAVRAPSEYDAWQEALKAECHNTPRMDSDGGSCWDGEFRYEVEDSTELDNHQYNTLKELRL